MTGVTRPAAIIRATPGPGPGRRSTAPRRTASGAGPSASSGRRLVKVSNCSHDYLVVRDWVCDGDRDCDDGSDEENCGDVRDIQEGKQINLEQAKSMSRKAAKPTEPAQDDKAGNTDTVKLITLEEAKNMSREAPSLRSTLTEEEEIKCDLETMFDCGPGEIVLKSFPEH